LIAKLESAAKENLMLKSELNGQTLLKDLTEELSQAK
jgi:hypothetical protein